MTTAIVPFFGANADELQEAIQENLGGGALDLRLLPHVVMPAGGATAWEVPSLGDADSVKVLEGVIVGWHYIRTYWKSEKTGDKVPPDCSSRDAVTGVGVPGGACVACPLARWKSDPKGGAGQACKQKAVLYLLRKGETLPIVVTLAPTSLLVLKTYLTQLSGAAKPFWAVVTRLALTKTTSKGGKEFSQAVISLAGALSPDDKAQAKALKLSIAAAIAAQEPATASGATDTSWFETEAPVATPASAVGDDF